MKYVDASDPEYDKINSTNENIIKIFSNDLYRLFIEKLRIQFFGNNEEVLKYVVKTIRFIMMVQFC